MAKAKKDIEGDAIIDKDAEKLIMGAYSVLDDYSSKSRFFSSDSMTEEINHISTGCHILDALISGKLMGGGVQEGKVTLFAAPAGVGKSYIALRIAANAQRNGKFVVYFDTENAITPQFMVSQGIDLAKCKYFPVRGVEQLRNALFALLNKIEDSKLDGKFVLVIDSIANMISKIEETRMEKDSTSADMGTLAKSIKSMLKTATAMGGQTNTTIICTNHIFENPSVTYTPVIKSMNGGHAVSYLPSTIIQMSCTQVKEGDTKKPSLETAVAGGKGITGIEIKAISVKNRFIKPFIECKMYLSFSTGLKKYYGLKELACEFGVMRNRVGRYYYDDDNGEEVFIGNYKDFAEDDEFWAKMIPKLQERIDKYWRYMAHDNLLSEDSESIYID